MERTTYLKDNCGLINKVLNNKIFNCGEQQIILNSLMISKRLSKKKYNCLIDKIMKDNNYM